MRVTFAILTLALAATAGIPSVQALDSTVCIPPGTLNQACVSVKDGQACAWMSGPSSIPLLCTELTADVQAGPVCVPPFTLNGVCVGLAGDGVCAWSWLGPNFSIACASPTQGVRVCSNHLFEDIYGPGFHCLP